MNIKQKRLCKAAFACTPGTDCRLIVALPGSGWAESVVPAVPCCTEREEKGARVRVGWLLGSSSRTGGLRADPPAGSSCLPTGLTQRCQTGTIRAAAWSPTGPHIQPLIKGALKAAGQL